MVASGIELYVNTVKFFNALSNFLKIFFIILQKAYRERTRTMDSSTIRQFWHLIEESSSKALLKLSEEELVKQLLILLEKRRPLSPQENECARNYIRERTLLIREMVEAGLA